MTNQNYWWSSGATQGGGGGGPGDQGENIGQSLRFRGASDTIPNMECPVRQNGRRSWTWSGWIKLAQGAACTLFVPGTKQMYQVASQTDCGLI